MTARLPDIEALGARVVVVSFDDLEAVARHREMLGLPFPVASDTTRAAYRAFGLERGSPLEIWHPRTLWRYAQLVARGRKLQRSKGDADRAQLGGDFVIAPRGRILLAHRSARPDDRPPVEALLRALRSSRDAEAAIES